MKRKPLKLIDNEISKHVNATIQSPSQVTPRMLEYDDMLNNKQFSRVMKRKRLGPKKLDDLATSIREETIQSRNQKDEQNI